MNSIPMAVLEPVSVIALLVAVGAVVVLQKVLGRLGDVERELKSLKEGVSVKPVVASETVVVASDKKEVKQVVKEEAQEKLDPETVAILTAAVAAYLKAPPKKLAIRFPVVSNLIWAQDGRGDIMLSHRVR